MSYTNRDPSGTPKIDANLVRFCRANGFSLVTLICIDTTNQTGDISLALAMARIPMVGEEVELENGACCEVQKVIHSVSKDPESGCFFATASVIATYEPQES